MSYLDVSEAIEEVPASQENEQVQKEQTTAQDEQPQEDSQEQEVEEKETKEPEGYEIKHLGKHVKITPDRVTEYLSLPMLKESRMGFP